MIGKVGWVGITVDDAEALAGFYSEVVGWEPVSVDMGRCSDFNGVRTDAVGRMTEGGSIS